MSNALTLFDVNGAGLRFGMTEDGTPYAVASDFSKALGHRDAHAATRLLDDAEKGKQIVSTPGGPQEMLVIYEDGLWELIFRSSLPGAKAIKARVKEILREIRETGGYGRPRVTAPEPVRLNPKDQMEVLARSKGIVNAKWLEEQARAVIARSLGQEAPATLDPLNPDEIPDVTAFIGVKPAEWTKRIPGIAPNAKLQKYIVTVLADHAGTRGLAEAMVRHLVTARWYAEGKKPNADAWMDAWHRVTSNPVTCEVGESRWALGRAIGA